MPPLQLFSRSWHVSSDDLALPGLIGVLFHGAWSVLIIVDVSILGLPDDCPQRQLATGSVLWLLASFVLTTCLQIWVTLISLRGALLEENKRANMPTALYCLLSAYCLEAAALTMTTVVFFGVISNTSTCYTAAELARAPNANVAIHRWFYATTWAALGAVAGLLVLLYNVYPDRTLDAWVDRVTCLSYVFCCWRSLSPQDTNHQDPTAPKTSAATPTVLRLAKVLGDVFFPLNFSFTDIVAAITLVGITHRSRAHGTGSSSHSHAVIAAAAAGLFHSRKAGGQRHGNVAADPAAADDPGRGNLARDHDAVLAPGTAAAAAAASGGVEAAPAAAASGASLGQLDVGLTRTKSPSAVPPLPDLQQPAAEAAAASLPLSQSHHQLLNLLLQQDSVFQQQQQQQPAARSGSTPAGDPSQQLSSQHDQPSADQDGSRADQATSAAAAAAALATSSREGLGFRLFPESIRARFGRGLMMDRASSDGAALQRSSAAAVAAGDCQLGSSADRKLQHQQDDATNSTTAVRSSSASTGMDLLGPPAQQSSAAAAAAAAVDGATSSTAGGAVARASPSLWEQAVRQASTLAVAPGYGVNRSVAGTIRGSSPTQNPISATRQGSSPASFVTSRVQGSRAALQSPRLQINSRRETEPSHGGVQHLLPAAGSSSAHSDPGVLQLDRGSGSHSQCSGVTQGLGFFLEHPGGLGFSSSSQGQQELGQLNPRAPATVTFEQCNNNNNTSSQHPRVTDPPTQQEGKAGVNQPAAAAAAAAAAAGTEPDHGSEIVSLDLLEEALHWHRYANAIYGWPMFLWSHRYRAFRCCGLCCGRCFKYVRQNVQLQQRSTTTNSEAGVAAADPVVDLTVKDAVRPDPMLPKTTPAASAAAAAAGSNMCGSEPHNEARALAEGIEGGNPNDHIVPQQQQGELQPLQKRASQQRSGSVADLVNHKSSSSSGGSSSSSACDLEEGGGSASASQDSAAAAAGASGAAAAAAVYGGPASEPDAARCFCCMPVGGGNSPYQSHMPKMPALNASQRLTREAIVQTAKIPDSALLHVNYYNLVEGLLPYSVALDEAQQCVVVAIRGSLSVEDCVTDILYDPAPLDADWLQPSAATAVPAAAAQEAATQQQQQQHQMALLPSTPPPAAAVGLTAAAKGAIMPDRVDSLRMSPFATAAAAAEHAAGSSSSMGIEQTLDQAGVVQRQQQWQQQHPSIPDSQMAAAAAAAASSSSQPALGSVRSAFAGPNAQQQQQQQSDSKLTMQPSFWHRRLGRYSLKSDLQQQQQELGTSASTKAGGLLKTLTSLRSALHISLIKPESSQTGTSILPTHTSVKFPVRSAETAGSGTTQRLRSSQSVNLTKSPWGQGSGQSNSQSSVDQMLTGQTRRTTAADRALGAARGSHKFGGAATAAVTCDQDQQQQQHESGTASIPSLGSVQSQQQQQQQQQRRSLSLLRSQSLGPRGSVLHDGGPTDYSLVTEAAVMTPSQTAAAPPAAAAAAAAAVAAKPLSRKPSKIANNAPDHAPDAAAGGGGVGQDGSSSSSSSSGVPINQANSTSTTQQRQRGSTQLTSQLQERPSVSPAAAAAVDADQQEAAAAAAQADAAEETPDTGAAGDQWYCHEGILNCARAIRDDLAKLGLLDQLLLLGQNPGSSSSSKGRQQWQQEIPDCRGWTLVLTGHSLGAGVAALLALHYRSIYPVVRCWCFSPPGGLMSPAAAASLKDICYSLISAKDMIPRMSLWTIERLRDEMMLCAIRCKVPKLKLLLYAAFGHVWEEHEVLRPLEELTPAQAQHYRRYRKAVNEERSLDPLRVRIAREFVPPGECIWLERYKVTRPRLRPLVPAAAAAAAEPGAAAAAAASGAVQRGSGSWGKSQASDVAGIAVIPAAAGAAQPADRQTIAAMANPLSRDSSNHGKGLLSWGKTLSTARTGGSTSIPRVGSAALAAALAGNVTVTRLRPHITDGLSLIVGGMVVSRNMFMDHVPDAQYAQLKRLVRWMRRQGEREMQSVVRQSVLGRSVATRREQGVEGVDKELEEANGVEANGNAGPRAVQLAVPQSTIGAVGGLSALPRGGRAQGGAHSVVAPPMQQVPPMEQVMR